MNTIDEFHSFVIGWGSGISFWCHRIPIPMEYKNPLVEEYHYYIAGYGFGIITLLLIVIGGLKCLI